MDSALFEYLFQIWKERELGYQTSNKRKYLHFDRQISFHKNIQWFKSYLSNAFKNVPKHGFYPFIKTEIITPRIKYGFRPGSNKKGPIMSKKVRPIAYASHFDAFLYSWYTTVLNYYYEEQLRKLQIDDCVLAYRKKGKSNIDFAFEVFEFIRRKIGKDEEYVALTYDLSSYFDRIDHQILKKQWSRILGMQSDQLPKDHFAIFKSLTNYTFVLKEDIDVRFPVLPGSGFYINRICSPQQFREVFVKEGLIQGNSNYNTLCDSKKFGHKCGIPQGSPISACLSNIYMIDFDAALDELCKQKGAIYRRYCDDLIVVCRLVDFDLFNEVILNTIKQYEVPLNEEKSEVVFFSKCNGQVRSYNQKKSRCTLQYLGFEFDGNNIFIRSSSMSRYAGLMNSKVHQSILDAYCDEFGQQDFIFRKKLVKRFTHHGSRNFVGYGKRAAQKMNSTSINRQVKNSTAKLEKVLRIKKRKIEENLISRGRVVNVKL